MAKPFRRIAQWYTVCINFGEAEFEVKMEVEDRDAMREREEEEAADS
jgi:hypothetical protein